MYVFPNSDLLLKSTIRRVAKMQLPNEHLWLKRMFTMPNSQVKNFVNACRGLYGNEKPEMTIAVVGSKAREGTGLWHKLFALYALSRTTSVHIDFYDSAERASYTTIEIGVKKATCTWIPYFIKETEVQEYDVVIDDAWIQGKSGLGVEIPFGSVKGLGTELFLHPSETRLFKSKVSRYQSNCPCLLCTEIAKCVDSYPEYQTIRMYCTRLGHNTNCESAFYNKDLTAVAGFMKELLTKPQVELRTNMMIRGLLSVMEEIPVGVEGAIVVTKDGIPEFSGISRFDRREIAEMTSEAPHLSGKRVLFIGVPSRVLGYTKLLNVEADTAQHKVAHTDAIVVANQRIWTQVVSARPHAGRIPDVYAPIPEEEVKKLFPGWVYVGKKFGSFFGYRMMDNKEKDVRIGQVCGNEWYPPTRLVPFLDVTKLGMPLTDGVVDLKQASYWRIVNAELQPQADPTFTDITDLLLVDVYGHWKLAHNKDTSSGHLRFGNFSYAFFHSAYRLGDEASKLLDLLLRAQLHPITKQQFLQLQTALPQMTIEATDFRPKKQRVSGLDKVTVKFYWSLKLVPKFVIDAMATLNHGPVCVSLLQEPLDQMESAWSRLVVAYGETYYDSVNRGKKTAKAQTGKRYGVKMKQ